MGRALEVVTGRALNPGAALTAVTVNTGDSLATRSTPATSLPLLEGLWASCATAGAVQVRSSRLHDPTQGIRFEVPAALIRNFLPDEIVQYLYPQDILTLEVSGGGAETDAAALMVYYPDLPGIDARLVGWEEIRSRIRNIVTVRVSMAGPVTAGDWSAGTALNATTDLLKPNVDYAVLGYQTNTNCLAVALRGADTGNLKVGGPGTTEAVETRDWFISLSKRTGLPHIPVINAAGKAGVLSFNAHTTAAGTIVVDWTMAELNPQ